MFLNKNPDVRKLIFLVTKGGARDPEGLTRMLNLSLERLQTDHIDLYFLHGISNPKDLNDDVKAWAAKAKTRMDVVYWSEPFEGKTRYYGVGMARGIKDRALRTVAADDQARAALLHALGLAQTGVKTQSDGSTVLTTEAEGLLQENQ